MASKTKSPTKKNTHIQATPPESEKAKPTISVVMIVKNEEHYLPRALASVVDWVDEIIVVDTGSTDRSVVIAQSFGALVYHQPWTGDFSFHRNKSIELASQDWCLILDADEELDQAYAPQLRQLAAQTGAMALSFMVNNVMADGGAATHASPRMFRNHCGVHYTQKVHNAIQIPGQVEHTPVVLFHYGYASSQSTMDQRHQRRLDMIGQWVKEEPENWQPHYYMSQTLVSHSETAEQAVEHALKALEIGSKSQPAADDYLKAFLPLLQGLNQMERHQETIHFAKVWAEAQPKNPDPRLFAARAFFGLKHWAQVGAVAQEFMLLHRELVRNPDLSTSMGFNSYGQLYSVLVIWCLAEAHLGHEKQAAEIVLAIRNLPNSAKVIELLKDEATGHGLSDMISKLERQTFSLMLPQIESTKPYRILSLYFGKQANLCLMENGIPLLVQQKERLTNIPHDQGQMMDLLPQILEQHDWSLDSVDLVTINPHIVPDHKGGTFEWEISGALYTRHSDYGEPNWSGPVAARTSLHKLNLFGRQIDCLALDHHLALAALAFFSSPFEEAGVLSADIGEDQRYLAAAYGKGNRLDWIEYDWGHRRGDEFNQLNPGGVWATLARHHFHLPDSAHPIELQELAAYGQSQPHLVEHLRRHMKYYWSYPIPTELFNQVDKLEPRSGFAQDLCASLQDCTNQVYLDAARYLKDRQDSPALCLSGSCALNYDLNAALHNSGLFSDTFVPSQPSIGGLALGQALYAWHQVLNQPREFQVMSPYLGNDLGQIPPSQADEIVEALAQGEIVALAQGKSENGLRGLGHRSILADPGNPRLRLKLRKHVMGWEWYRAFGALVLGEDLEQWFEDRVPGDYMAYSATALSGQADKLPVVTRIDGRMQLQVLNPGSDPLVREILKGFKEKTGCALLLNAPFNSKGILVDSLDQTKSAFQHSAIDMLATPQGVMRK